MDADARSDRAGSTENSGEDRLALTRRAMLLVGAAACLTGCSSGSGSMNSIGRRLPAPPWSLENGSPAGAPPRAVAGRRGSSTGGTTLGLSGIRPRSAWGARRAIPSGMNRMVPIRAVTIHHDAVLLTDSGEASVRSRIAGHQRYHMNDRDWADVGYHFMVDRRGVIWEGRGLGWQGAHVKDHNEGNIGVMALGNYNQQSPTSDQLAGLVRIVRACQTHYGVPGSAVRTHQEWRASECPGRYLQSAVEQQRARGAFRV